MYKWSLNLPKKGEFKLIRTLDKLESIFKLELQYDRILITIMYVYRYNGNNGIAAWTRRNERAIYLGIVISPGVMFSWGDDNYVQLRDGERERGAMNGRRATKHRSEI